MNAYIQLVKKKVAPNDPLINEPCQVDEFCDEVLAEALNLRKYNPVIHAKTKEYANFEEDVEDEFLLDLNCNDASSNRFTKPADKAEAPIGISSSTPKKPLVIQTVEVSHVDLTNCNDKSGINEDEEENVGIDVGERKCLKESETLKLSKHAKECMKLRLMERTVILREIFAQSVSENISNNLAITIEDYGSEKPLPHYGLNRPNADYFNSSIHLRIGVNGC